MSTVIITADPNFLDLAWQEYCRAAIQPGKRAQLSDGIIVATHKGRFPALAERLRQMRPTFLRHISPADHILALSGDEAEDVRELRKLVRNELADELVTGSSFSVQTRIVGVSIGYKPYAINKPLSDEVTRQSGAQLDVRQPKQIVSCMISQLEKQTVAFVGLSQAQHNLSDWAGGERRFRREKGQISRAEFKLLEAFEWFNITPPAKGTVLDLGAAPGGWTRVIRELEHPLPVIAVDPAELHPSLQKDWGVHHVRKSAEIYLLNLNDDQRFTLILNDMRLDSRRSAEALLSFAHYLADDGYVILSVKLPQFNPQQRLKNTLRLLRKGYTIVGVKQLFHNRHEVTVLMEKRN